MNIFLPIFKALQQHGVRYLTVGGLATVLHGYARLTADIDLIIQLEEANCLKGIEALLTIGFKPRAPVDARDFANREKRESWISEKGLTVFSLYGNTGIPIEVDLFVREPIDFNKLWNKKVDRDIDGVTIHVIDKNSLIELKKLSGRPKDLEDIKALQELDDENG